MTSGWRAATTAKLSRSSVTFMAPSGAGSSQPLGQRSRAASNWIHVAGAACGLAQADTCASSRSRSVILRIVPANSETLDQSWTREGASARDRPVPGLLMVFTSGKAAQTALPLGQAPLVLG